MKYTLQIKITEDSSSTIVRNIYECFRMLGDAFLIFKGIGSIDHLLPIKELMDIKIQTNRPINLLDNLRRLRHNINYYGYKPNIKEVEEVVDISKNLFSPLLNYILKGINKI